MFFYSSRAFLVALIACVAAVSADPSTIPVRGLAVKTWASNVNVVGLKNLKVTTTITNTGMKSLKLLNEPRGVLSSFPDDSFVITNATGSSPSFKGARAKYSPKYAAGLNDPRVFTVLGPGNSIDVTHDLSVAYDFTQSGAGDYFIRPLNSFIYVDDDRATEELYATIKGIAKIKLSGDLAVSGPASNKRSTFNSCSSHQKKKIIAAATAANRYATKAFTHVQRNSASTRRYKAWFGAYNATNKAIVQSHFEKISGNDFSKYIYDCSCTKPDTYAYVFTTRPRIVNLCSAFWKTPTTGKNSKAGILIHEASHFNVNGGARDLKYGRRDCIKLAKKDPASAAMNAASHQLFAENSCTITGCF